MESYGMQILNKLVSDYHYWKRTGKFPEDEQHEKLIRKMQQSSNGELVIRGGHGNPNLIYFVQRMNELDQTPKIPLKQER